MHTEFNDTKRIIKMHLINKKSLWLLIKLKFLNELSTFQWDRSFNECSFFIEKYAGAPKWEKVHSYTTPVLEWTYKLLQYQSTVWFEYDAWILFCMDISNYRRDKQNYFYVEVTAESQCALYRVCYYVTFMKKNNIYYEILRM